MGAFLISEFFLITYLGARRFLYQFVFTQRFPKLYLGRIFTLIIATFAIVSCSATPDTEELKGGIEKYIDRASSSSVWGGAQRFVESAKMDRPCANPSVAKASAQFKYGCYCGAYHPPLSYPKTLSEEQLVSRREKDLTRVRPYDEIDALCQVHDICHARGIETRDCNIYFARALLRRARSFQQDLKSTSLNDTGTRQEILRCQVLATTIAEVMNGSLAPAVSSQGAPKAVDSALNWTSNLGAVLRSPLYATQYAFLDGQPFPGPGKRCIRMNG